MHSVAIYDFAAAVLRGEPPARRDAIFAMPLRVWRRVLGFEGCAVQFDHALVRLGLAEEAPDGLRQLLREETTRALRHGLLVHRQLPAVAALAAAHGIQLLALKGAARLLAGEPAGARSIADIDLLVDRDDAPRIHALLQAEHGYSSERGGALHHLPGLTRAGCLGIEIHHRLSPDPTALDATIREHARVVRFGDHSIGIPSPTALLLHTLEHAVGVNWMGRYRLRDIVDAATLCAADVSLEEISDYVRASPSRAAMETLLSAAHELEPRAPRFRAGAWSVVRRVSRTRIALAVIPERPAVAERLFRYGGILAEGSPRTVWRAGSELVARGLAHAASIR